MTPIRVRHKWTGDKGIAISKYGPNNYINIRWDNPSALLNDLQREDMLVFIVPAGRRVIDTRANWRTFRDELL